MPGIKDLAGATRDTPPCQASIEIVHHVPPGHTTSKVAQGTLHRLAVPWDRRQPARFARQRVLEGDRGRRLDRAQAIGMRIGPFRVDKTRACEVLGASPRQRTSHPRVRWARGKYPTHRGR